MCVVALSGWTAWYVTVGAYRDLPGGKCVIRQPRFVLNKDGVTRQAMLSTSFWLDVHRMHVSGCFEHEKVNLSIDRSGSLQTLFRGDGSLLCRVNHVAYTARDSAAAHPLPSALPDVGDEIDLRFRKLASNAWIVETGDDRVGMCISEP
nr:T3SS regulator BprQ [Burkholderia pseudomallei]